jgi:hypothetical protein
MTAVWMHSGKVIMFDSTVGTVSAHSEHQAWQEIARRKEHKRQMDARR